MSKRARLADTVRDDLLDRIVSGSIAPGSLLPNEEELAASSGVSRIVIRDAVKGLEANGILAARAGIGTVVLPESQWNVLDPKVLGARLNYDREGVFFEDLTTIRVALESQMAAQAAVLATAEQRRDRSRTPKRTCTSPTVTSTTTSDSTNSSPRVRRAPSETRSSRSSATRSARRADSRTPAPVASSMRTRRIVASSTRSTRGIR